MKKPEEIKKGLERCPGDPGCDHCMMASACNIEAEALAYIQQLEAQVPKWISVEERLPENDRMVIGFTPCDGFMFVGYYHEEKMAGYKWEKWKIITAMRSTKDMVKKVTHWMPLPEPPKED